MLELVIWTLILFGVCMTTTKSKIFLNSRNYLSAELRVLEDLVNCPICVSFWVALPMSFWYSPTGFALTDGILALGVTWILVPIVWALALKDKNF